MIFTARVAKEAKDAKKTLEIFSFIKVCFYYKVFKHSSTENADKYLSGGNLIQKIFLILPISPDSRRTFIPWGCDLLLVRIFETMPSVNSPEP